MAKLIFAKINEEADLKNRSMFWASSEKKSAPPRLLKKPTT